MTTAEKTQPTTTKRADELVHGDLRLTTQGYAEVALIQPVGTDRVRVLWIIERHGKTLRYYDLAARAFTYTIESH